MTRRLSAAVFVAALLAVGVGSPAAAAPDEGTILRAGGPTAIAGSYIVVLKDSAVSRDAVSSLAGALAGKHEGKVGKTYQHALRGFEAQLSEADAKRLAADPAVRYVQQNHTVRVDGFQGPTPSWGLDRIDQRALPLNNGFNYPNSGSGVTAYVIDTGILPFDSEFGGFWGRARTGLNLYPDEDEEEDSTDDCHGHGTHVAGTIGGVTYGVAKDVQLVALKVFDCGGYGAMAGVVYAVDWVTANHQPGQPAVANMSLSGGFSPAANEAVTASIADGVVYTIAAGNGDASGNGVDACGVSPASTPNAITVGASQRDDARTVWSNFGTCLDVFAPGADITSLWLSGTANLSGTSMAAPHVAGAAALVLAAHPTWTPQQVRDKLVADAVTGVVANAGTGSPNRLLNTGNIAPPSHDFSSAVNPAAASVRPGNSVSATVSTATTVGAANTVSLSATGLPAGATASFSPSSVTSGGSSTVTISTTAATPPGTYPVRISGTGPATTQLATYTLTVAGPAGCAQSTSQDLHMLTTEPVDSVLEISGCPGAAAVNSTVEVHISHVYQMDLVATLIAPDGTTYPLHNREGSGDVWDPNLDRTYTVNLSGEVANGTWRLRVQDAYGDFIYGFLTMWSLNLRPAPPPAGLCTRTNGTDVSYSGTVTVQSSANVSGCPGNGWSSATAEVHLTGYPRDALVVSLIAPDGTAYVLHDREDRSTYDLDRVYQVNLSGEARNGTWRLQVQSHYNSAYGKIDSWTLTL